jgi:nitrous oxidase accessory protein NosD
MGNYVHDPGFRTDDADQSGNAAHPYWSHNDGVQIRGGINHMIDGNRCVMKFSTLTGMNSTANPSPTAEQVWPNCHGIISDPAFNNVSITIQRNWFEYGACGIHLTQNTYTGNSAYISSNRFTPNQSQEFGVYTQMRIDPTTIWSLTELNNVYSDESDTPIAWRGQPLKAPSVFGTTKAWMFNSGAHTP